ncbi:MAG: methyltransferase domain-containing protein [Alphaproteobacteria bacterium]|nr:methyltransferase domain-containing protein [Alphaproteobacteria bacterium]
MPPDETLIADCAAEAHRIAPNLCGTDPETGESCAWYHGFWPYLRALGIVTTPDTHRAFYDESLRTLARQPGFRRVLISGSADFNMLEQVYAAFDAADATPEVVFVDRCPTPVALAEWYARRFNRTVEARASDILTFRDKPFDIICTHSFMGYFTDDARQTLAATWASLLRPGGKVVTINRIRPDATGVMGFTPEQAEQFAEKARSAALSCATPLNIGVDEIARAAQLYGQKFRIRPVQSIKILGNFFEANGFSINLMDGMLVPGHEGRRGTGPTTPAGATYVHMIATRR